MANQVTGVVTDKIVTPNSTSITVNGERYGSYKGAGFSNVDIGDTIDFLWNPDKTGKYKNVLGTTVKVLSKGAGNPVPSATSTAGPSRSTFKPTYSTVGVELGHASKLAMDMTLNYPEFINEDGIGSDAFYKFWIKHTNKIYEIMSKLREAKEKEKNAPSVVVPKGVPEPITVDDEEALKSIF